MDHLPHEMRLSNTARGIFIAVLIGGYSWAFKQPAASLTWSFLAAAGIQLVVIALRRFVPPANLPVALYLLELFADAATVFMFALGVYGGLLNRAAEV
ncbi:MAG TPA: hypothetical protein VGO61_06720 [Steroidobacteraceae bacterium]|jgi:hypothetical protein|nr:hypothetical protein [Steroidobacteraceae bacterium]